MTPKLVWLGAVSLAALQTSQAFLLPSTFNFPGKHAHDKNTDDVVSTLPIPKEDQWEKLKNLQLGVSKPWPFPISSDDKEEAKDKMRHYYKSWCKKFKGDASKLAAKVPKVDLDEADSKFLQWWKDTMDKIPEMAQEFKDEIENEIEDLEIPKKAQKFKDEIEEEWEDLEIPKKAQEFKDEIEEEWEDLKKTPMSAPGFSGYTEDETPDEAHFDRVQVFELDDEELREFLKSLRLEDHWHHTDDDDDDDDDSKDGSRVYWADFPEDDDDNDSEDNGRWASWAPLPTVEYADEDNEDLAFWPHLPTAMDEPNRSPEGNVGFRPPHRGGFSHGREGHRGHGRCMKSKLRRAMHSIASALRAFITGFLIPVLVGVAAGMTASLFGMMVGTFCGWLWVKLVHGGRRSNDDADDAEFVQYQHASCEAGEKDTLLTVAEVESDGEEAPPLYVEKE